jgi:hypothetical protein
MSDNRLTIRLDQGLHDWLKGFSSDNMSVAVRTMLDDVRAGRLVPAVGAIAPAQTSIDRTMIDLQKTIGSLDTEAISRMTETCESLDISLRRMMNSTLKERQKKRLVRFSSAAVLAGTLLAGVFLWGGPTFHHAPVATLSHCKST